MLKSTHKPTFSPPLLPGWTEHKAPTGHSYYYNAATKQSTYTRPTQQDRPPAHASARQGTQDVPVGLPRPLDSFGPVNHSYLNYHGQNKERGFSAELSNEYRPSSQRNGHRGRGDFRGGRGYQDRRRHHPEDRPKSKHAIPECYPWLLIKTKLGRRFVYNPDKDESFWKFPVDIMKGVVEYDRIEREKKEGKERGEESVIEDEATIDAADREAVESHERVTQPSATPGEHATLEEDSDEYEEVEVTDDDDEEGPSKRQKTDQSGPEQAVEFDEDDIAYQLAAMGQDYGLDPGEYGDGDGENWEEGMEGLPLTEEDSNALFKDMLDDYTINPYTPWEKIIEEGRIIEDDRYTVLPNMKSRKEVWDDWSRDKILKLKEHREKEERKDPRIPYLAFLQKNGTPKLYWPEFRRKYKKEPEMRDTKLSDKDREKWYREYINRLKLPESTLKSDLSSL
ncbi:MAG: hypothetical protein M1830_004763, partial [Pleopsidium flavum]